MQQIKKLRNNFERRMNLDYRKETNWYWSIVKMEQDNSMLS